MTKTRCLPCSGSGRVMGGGMMLSDCEACDGVGKVAPSVSIKDFEIDKNSARYKDAIVKIKALDRSLTDDKAHEIFHDACNALDEPDVKGVAHGSKQVVDIRTKPKKG